MVWLAMYPILGIGHTSAMPELPEVETVARDLQRLVAGATIRDATVHWDRTIRHPQPPERFAAEIAGATIRRVDRRAKTVLLHLDDGRVMTVALRMTGALIVAPAGTPPDPYARVVFRAGRRARAAVPRRAQVRADRALAGRRPAQRRRRARRAVEARRGGRPRYRIGEVFSGHGPEPLSSGFTVARFKERLARRSAKLKTLLLDQILHRRRREHLRRRGTVARAAPPAAGGRHARRCRGAAAASGHPPGAAAGDREPRPSFSDYVGADGEPGANAERLAVYRRTDQPCYRCGRPIERIVVGQRSTHFCPHCQPEPVGSDGP